MGKINKQKLIFWLIILIGILIRIYNFPVALQKMNSYEIIIAYVVGIPFIIVSIVAMSVFYDLIRKISKNGKIALIGLALVSISPWYMIQSLRSLDCNMFPHFLIIAIDMFYTGIKKDRNILTYISMIFFAITLYYSGIAVYFVPLFLVVIMLYLLKTKTLKIKNVAICAVVFLVFALPIIIMFATNVLNTEESIELGIFTIPYYEGL